VLAVLAVLACGPAPEPVVPPAPDPPPDPVAPAAAPPPPAKPAPRADASLPPRDVLFGNPDRARPRLSPDGKRLAFLAPVDGVLNVWVGPASDPAAAKPVTSEKKRGLRFYDWAYTSDDILFMKDKDGDENWHVHRVALKSGAIADLTPFDGAQARIEEMNDRHPREVLVSINDRDAKAHDVYLVSLDDKPRKLVFKNEAGYAGVLSDEDLRVRAATMMRPDGGMDIVDPAAKPGAPPILAVGQEDSLTTEPLGFEASGKTLYLLDSRGRDTAGLFAMDWKTRKTTLLFEDPKADAQDVLVHPKDGRVQAVASTYQRKEWRVLDKSLEGDFAYLRTVADGDLDVVSRSLDDKRWIVAFSLSDGPTRFFLHERGKKEAKPLFSTQKALESLPLVKMTPVTIRARDGLALVSYLSLPKAADADGDGRPAQPLPLVLLVHGGPWARDSWGYSATHQWLASRGYAVLSVNYRGSTGFGKAFINAADGEWARRMHDDLIDATRWAVEAKVADPARIGIYGGSYGGYSTLVGLTMTPDAFACGVDIVGPSSLVTLLQSVPPYWAPMLALMRKRIGDETTDAGKKLLLERSPLTYVGNIKRPLLIGQGANDPRVKQAESDQIVKAMQAKGIPVTYVLYGDEGHGFGRPENRTSFNAVAEVFLAQCLGGVYEPYGDDLRGSSIAVPAGAAEVTGLSEALSTR
jgi:dipeptidyl aminopeptidase/acylaminoacyl peptidase